MPVCVHLKLFGFKFELVRPKKKRRPCAISSSHFAHCMQFDYEIAIVTRRWNACDMWHTPFQNNNRREFTHIYLLLLLFLSNYHHLFDIIHIQARFVYCENTTKFMFMCLRFKMRIWSVCSVFVFLFFFLFQFVFVSCASLLLLWNA